MDSIRAENKFKSTSPTNFTVAELDKGVTIRNLDIVKNMLLGFSDLLKQNVNLFYFTQEM